MATLSNPESQASSALHLAVKMSQYVMYRWISTGGSPGICGTTGGCACGSPGGADARWYSQKRWPACVHHWPIMSHHCWRCAHASCCRLLLISHHVCIIAGDSSTVPKARGTIKVYLNYNFVLNSAFSGLGLGQTLHMHSVLALQILPAIFVLLCFCKDFAWGT